MDLGRPGPAHGRARRNGLVIALLLGVGLALTPATARPAAAADPLRVSADATYTLDPGAGRVHVLIRYAVTDLKPNSSQFIYYYTGYRFAIQREAKSVRASDAGGALTTGTTTHARYIELEVRFRRNLYYQDTASFTVRYDLVGGAPRSASSIRVGKAFATWGVWAWGDPGRGSVVVNLPQGFGSSIDGGPMSKTTTSDTDTWRAKPEKPEEFFAVLSAENPLAYRQDRLSLDGGVEIVVMSWPEDHRWDDSVRATLRSALPDLQKLIGLDWPVTHDLNVRERYTPALEGYAGVFFTEDQRIDVSEDLDPLVIVHEASHAWFNDSMFPERWIYEGLAEEYAWRVQQEVGGEDGGPPTPPDPKDPGRILLSRWTFPEVIRDQKTDDRERYGYEASFWMIHLLVHNAGVDVMQGAFAAADAHTTAYPGAATPETVTPNSWRRLVDLSEPLDRADPVEVEDALRQLVLPPSDAAQLNQRTAARSDYRKLLDAGDGWLPGWYVRRPMGEWSFDVAEQRMTQAETVLALRDEVEAAAGPLDLHPDGALQAAYEGADNGFDDATALANDELAALTAISDANAAVTSEPDLISKIGLIGADARVGYEGARTRFESGDIAGSKAWAEGAVAVVAGARSVGEQRLAIGIGAAIALLMLIVVLRRLGRRRRRRAAAALAGAAAAGPYATLAADPDAAPPSTSELPPMVEGGPVPGERPADSELPSSS
jgi:hypothetical protein